MLPRVAVDLQDLAAHMTAFGAAFQDECENRMRDTVPELCKDLDVYGCIYNDVIQYCGHKMDVHNTLLSLPTALPATLLTVPTESQVLMADPNFMISTSLVTTHLILSKAPIV